MIINNEVAMVTGAASGIGRALTFELAQRGAKAIGIVDLSDDVFNIADKINSRVGGQVALPFKGDVTAPDFRKAVYDQICAEHGVVTICVPAAGLTRDALAVRLNKETGQAQIYEEETFRLVTEVDLIAPIYWALEAVARMAEYRHKHGKGRWNPAEGVQGTIIFIGSVSSQGNKGADCLCNVEGWSRGRGGDNDERSDLLRCTLWCNSSGLYRYTDGPGTR